MVPSSRLEAASIRATPSPPAATQTLPPATAMPAGLAGKSLITATTRLLARSMRATAPRPVATHPAPAPTATSDGTKRRSPGATWNGSRSSLILATTRPVPGSSRTTSSVSGYTTQIVPAPTARPTGFGPPAGKRATPRLERGSTRTTWRSRRAPPHRLPAPNTSGPPPWPTSICAVAQRSGGEGCWGGTVVAGVGCDRDAGSSGLVMRPTTASTATAPSTAAPTRSLSRGEAIGCTPSQRPSGPRTASYKAILAARQTGGGRSPPYAECGRGRVPTCVGNAGDFTGRTAVSPRVPEHPHLVPIMAHDVQKQHVDGFGPRPASPAV